MELWRLLRTFGRATLCRLAVIVVIIGMGYAATNAILAQAALGGVTVGHSLLLAAILVVSLTAATFGRFHVIATLNEHVQRANAKIQLGVLQRAIATELSVIERIGLAQLIGSFSRCAAFMAAAVELISHLIYPAYGVIGVVIVLALPPSPVLAVFVCMLAILVAGWAFSQGLLLARHRQALASERRLSSALAQLVSGFKEIKLSPIKGVDLQKQQIAPLVAAATTARAGAGSIIALNEVLVNAVPLLLMGITGLLAPALFPGLAKAGAVATTVIVMLPTGILAMVGNIARSNAAYGEIADLERRLKPSDAKPAADRNGSVRPETAGFESVAFKDVTFSYRDADGRPGFGVGPLTFTILANQITFIIGGNGSGKSTITKLLTGFYQPDRGQILLNGVPVGLRASGDLFGAIFTDFHLFDQLYGHRTVDEAHVNELLGRFGIADVTRYEGGRFTNLDLSTGQKKRLAMVVCLLDDKPVPVLDEWAADQDPDFRRMYYRQLLPELRAAGKTIIAVSHDDRYFDAADDLIRLEYGRLVQSQLAFFDAWKREIGLCRNLQGDGFFKVRDPKEQSECMPGCQCSNAVQRRPG